MEILQKDSVFPVPLNLCKLAILPRDMSLLQKSIYVIPAKAGIQAFQALLEPGFRRGDGIGEFCKSLRKLLFEGLPRARVVDSVKDIFCANLLVSEDRNHHGVTPWWWE
jgi:hypothetical protein